MSTTGKQNVLIFCFFEKDCKILIYNSETKFAKGEENRQRYRGFQCLCVLFLSLQDMFRYKWLLHLQCNDSDEIRTQVITFSNLRFHTEYYGFTYSALS